MTEGPDRQTPFRYHLELTPAQLKLTHTALRSLLDDFGHDEPEVRAIVQEVLAKLPDEHAIRAIQLGGGRIEAVERPDGGDDEPSPAAA